MYVTQETKLCGGEQASPCDVDLSSHEPSQALTVSILVNDDLEQSYLFRPENFILITRAYCESSI